MKLLKSWPLIAIALGAVACGTSGPDHQSNTSPASSTRSVPPKLVAPTQAANSSLPRVTFDPCLDIPDAVISAAGFDPNSKERNDVVGDVFAKLGCYYYGFARSAVVSAYNSPFDEQREKYASQYQPTEINGREAIMGTNIANVGGCTVEMRTNFGEVILDTSNSTNAEGSALGPCQGVVEIAQQIERTIPK